MVVRLAFAIQAMVDPDILIVDEALAVGDEKFQRKCFARLEELKSRGTSILFVSHSVSQIMELCDQTLLLEHGERLMYESPAKVINAYQKLIYAPFTQQLALIKEYKQLDQSPVNPVSARLQSNISPPKSRADAPLEQLRVAPLSDRNQTHETEFYDPGLVPDSTVVYPVQGAEIHSIRILDPKNRSVNLLSFGQEYRFEVSGKFLANREKVYFGLHIRTISGLIITGQRYPEEGKYIDKVYAGDNFSITFGFKILLSPDTYFSGGGIWSMDEPHCLHRILDAAMFRVLPEQRIRFLGYVDVSSTEPVLKIG
jgi:lipopolysaccharide transport system ATP-binding protein